MAISQWTDRGASDAVADASMRDFWLIFSNHHQMLKISDIVVLSEKKRLIS
jgi:hypothetical protein